MEELKSDEEAIRLITKIFTEIFPKEGLLFREAQLNLAKAIFCSLQSGRVAIMEAEVGIGKTYAYMIAVIVYNLLNQISDTTVISTSTVALQKVITKEYIPCVSDILMKYGIIKRQLNFAIRKGKSHYVCDKKLNKYLNSLKKTNSEKNRILIEELQNLCNVSAFNIDLDAYKFSQYVRKRICVTHCSGYCPEYKKCRFFLFINKCRQSNCYFQITNHNYIFADILRNNSLLPKYSIIIFDEAHKLYDAAKQMYKRELTYCEVEDWIKGIRQTKAFTLEGFCSNIEQYNRRLFERLRGKQFLNHKIRTNIESDQIYIYCLKRLALEVDILCDKIIECEKIKSHAKRYSITQEGKVISDKLEYLTNLHSLVCWYERSLSEEKITAIPKNMNWRLYHDLWNIHKKSILTSGTLSAEGSFSLFKKKLGIDIVPDYDLSEGSWKAPFDYKENAIIYIPEHIPFPDKTNPEYISAITNEIEKLLAVTYGHALVLFTSYKLMELVFNKINHQKYDYPMFIMSRGRLDVLKQFKSSGNGVLFASDTAGEGIDIAGDTLSNLIIVKLPFDAPDAVSRYRQKEIGGLAEYKRQINTPNMLIKLKQYVGRLIRSENDTGVAAILDSRVNSSGRYRNVVLDSIFTAEVTNSLETVREFISDKKDISYFK